jgi:cell division protein FtsQ
MAGVPAMAKQQVDALAMDAGFVVRTIELRGTDRLNEDRVYQRVLGERPMTQLDLEQVRSDLLELSWVKDARVSRRLPSSLVIDIVERKPHAVLRKPDRYVLVDGTGHELEPISQAAARSYLLIDGPGAGRQVPALTALLEAAPALDDQVAEAKWVGNRRWDIIFKTGQVLALPEGSQPAASALAEFARIDGINRLLEGPAVAFDMRAPDRIYMRCPQCREDERAALAEAAASAKIEEADPGDGQ